MTIEYHERLASLTPFPVTLERPKNKAPDDPDGYGTWYYFAREERNLKVMVLNCGPGDVDITREVNPPDKSDVLNVKEGQSATVLMKKGVLLTQAHQERAATVLLSADLA